MARCIDLFIDKAHNQGGVGPVAGPSGPSGLAGVAGMAEELCALTGLTLTEEPATGSWAGRADGARVELAAHDFLDDRHMALSTFRYDLFARVPSAEAHNSPEAALLRRVLAAVKADGRFRALLVWDLQNVLDGASGPVPQQPE